MSGRIGKKCGCGCNQIVYFTPPMRGDRTLSEANHEIQRLKLELQTANAELHQLQKGKSMIRALTDSFTRTLHQVTGGR